MTIKNSEKRDRGRRPIQGLPKFYEYPLLSQERVKLRTGRLKSRERTSRLARPSKLWGLTSRDWTTRDQIARVDIARPDNVAPNQTEVYNLYGAWNIRPI